MKAGAKRPHQRLPQRTPHASIAAMSDRRGRRQAAPRKRAPARRTRAAWATLPDDQLLKLRLKDLDLTVAGTPLEPCVDELYGELEERGIRTRPHVWISDDWFSPENTPGIALPFYLAHPRLKRLERKMMLDVEGGTRSRVHAHPAA